VRREDLRRTEEAQDVAICSKKGLRDDRAEEGLEIDAALLEESSVAIAFERLLRWQDGDDASRLVDSNRFVATRQRRSLEELGMQLRELIVAS